MLNEFIEKVVVHEATGGRAHRKQKVDIYFNFIGNFVLPKPEAPILSEEEREQNKLRMRRVRAEQKAAKEKMIAGNLTAIETEKTGVTAGAAV